MGPGEYEIHSTKKRKPSGPMRPQLDVGRHCTLAATVLYPGHHAHRRCSAPMLSAGGPRPVQGRTSLHVLVRSLCMQF